MISLQALLGLDTVFHAEDYLLSLHSKKIGFRTSQGFHRACQVLQEYLDAMHEDNLAGYRKDLYDAVRGVPVAKAKFMSEIQAFLRLHPEYRSLHYPNYYDTLTEALYEHQLGFGPMSVWFKHPTEKAQVNGTTIQFSVPGSNRKVLQPFQFDSIDQVERLIRSITMGDPLNQVNEMNPTTEVEMVNGSRVTIFVKPMTRDHPILIFRQYLVKQFSFDYLAQVETIDPKAILWWQALSRLMLSVLVTGFRGSGKTTLLKILFGARDPDLTVLSVETGTFEIRLEEAFPDRSSYILPLRSQLDDMNDHFPKFLRSDVHYVVVPEVRSHEVEILLKSGERANGVLASYHDRDVYGLPEALARLSVERYPHFHYEHEVRRAAKSLDIVILMDELDDGRKVIQGVYLYDYDPVSSELSIVPWTEFDMRENRWKYHCTIPEHFKKRVAMRYRHAYDTFLSEFRKLESQAPLQTTVVTKQLK